MINEHTEKLQGVVKDRVAVFIDAANLERSVQDMWVNPKDVPDELRHMPVGELRWTVDYERLRVFFKEVGRLQHLRFYTADFRTESHRDFLYFLRKGPRYKIISKPLKEYDDHTPEQPHRKANFDVEIATDATFYLGDFETFVLFSGDSDFAYLLGFLRGHGKIAIVFSRSGHVAKELPPASSYYFDIVDFRKDFLKIVPRKKQRTPP